MDGEASVTVMVTISLDYFFKGLDKCMVDQFFSQLFFYNSLSNLYVQMSSYSAGSALMDLIQHMARLVAGPSGLAQEVL